MSSYLPPVVIDFQGDATDFDTTLAEVKSALADLEKDTTDVPIGGDLKPLETKIATIPTLLKNLSGANVPIGGNLIPLDMDIATAKTTLVALAKDVTKLPLGAKLDLTQIAKTIAAARAEIDKQEANVKLGVDPDLKQIATKIAAVVAAAKAAKADVPITGHNSSALTKIAAVVAAAKAVKAEVPISADSKSFETTYATVVSQLLTLTKTAHNVDLGADTKGFYTEAAAVLTAANKMQADIKLGAKPDWTELTAELAAMKTFVKLADLTATIHVNLEGAGKTVTAAGVESTLLALLGLGGGKGTNKFGLPAAGSLLAMGGLGVEHLITTIASIIASAIGAVTGGAILAATSGSIIAVGGGSDLLVGASVAADVKAMYTLIAANAQESYAAAMKTIGLPQDTGTQSEWKMAQSLVALNSYWDTATSAARTAAVNLYTKFLSVADTYIPLIGTAATKNFQAISKAIQPLIDWLNSPTGGVAIFKTLEGAFLKNVPKSVTTFTNAVEGILKIFANLTPQTGGFLNSVSKFFAQLNTIAGQKNADIHIQSLISDFHTWVNFLKTMISTIYNVFSASKKPNATGVGESIIQTLTGFLTEIDNFAKSVSGKAAIGNLLTVHKNEALAILDMIPPIAKALATVYGAIAPGLVKAITDLILGVVAAINTLAKLKIGKFELGDWAVGLGLIALKLTGLGSVIGGLAAALGKAALITGIKAIAALANTLGATKVGSWLSNLIGKGGTKAAFVDAVFTGAKFAGTLGGAGGVATTSTSEEEAEAGGFGAAAGKLAGPLIGVAAAYVLATFLSKLLSKKMPSWLSWLSDQSLKNDLNGGASGDVSSWTAIAKAIQALHGDLSTFLTLSKKKLQTPAVQGAEVNVLVNIASSLKGKSAAQVAAILSGLTPSQQKELTEIMNLLGVHLVNGVESGITKEMPQGKAAMEAFCIKVIDAANKAMGTKSPSTVFATLGGNLILGLTKGIQDKAPTVKPYLQNLWHDLLTYLQTLPSKMQTIGDQLMLGLAKGIEAGTPAAVAAAVKAAKAVEAATKAATKAQSPSMVYAAIGNDLMAGLAQGIKNGTGLAKSAMVSSLNTITPTAANLAGRGLGMGGGGITMNNTYHVTIGATGSNPNSVTEPLKQAFAQHDADLIRRIKAGSSS